MEMEDEWNCPSRSRLADAEWDRGCCSGRRDGHLGQNDKAPENHIEECQVDVDMNIDIDMTPRNALRRKSCERG